MNRGALDIIGGSNNRRPPWAVPLRYSYPVTTEPERRRVGVYSMPVCFVYTCHRLIDPSLIDPSVFVFALQVRFWLRRY